MLNTLISTEKNGYKHKLVVKRQLDRCSLTIKINQKIVKICNPK